MNFFLFAGIVILGTFLIKNAHSTASGIRNRKINPSKASKNGKMHTIKEQSKYSGGLASTPGTTGVPGAVPNNPYPDTSDFDDSNGWSCCNRGGKKNPPPSSYPYGGYNPIGTIPSGPMGNIPSGPIGISPPTAPAGTDIVGFAKEFNTTGGAGGEVVQINTLADLIQYAGDSIPRVLNINSDIKAKTLTKVQLGSSKSIVGLNGNAKLYNIYLRATPTTRNIIFQNLIFEHSANNKNNDDIQLYLNYGSAYWIDHCSFAGHEWSENDGSLDKLLYIGEGASGATISNCYFGNHHYGLIFGHPGDDLNVVADYDTRVTIFNSHFENMHDRAPGLFRFGLYHVFNNIIENYELGFTVATKGDVISEYNAFGKSPNTNAMLDDKGDGAFIDTGSVPPILNQISPKPNWSPSYPYYLNTNIGPISSSAQKKYGSNRFAPPIFKAPFSSLLVPPPIQVMAPPNVPRLP